MWNWFYPRNIWYKKNWKETKFLQIYHSLFEKIIKAPEDCVFNQFSILFTFHYFPLEINSFKYTRGLILSTGQWRKHEMHMPENDYVKKSKLYENEDGNFN